MKNRSTKGPTLLVAAAVVVALAAGAPTEGAVPELCGAGVSCMGAGLTRACTAVVFPQTMTASTHFIGQQASYPGNNNAICIQGADMNTFTGTAGGLGGTNLMFGGGLMITARRNVSASATNPQCIFVLKTGAYSVTAICTINMADGLPVELMEFGIEEEDGSEGEDSVDSTQRAPEVKVSENRETSK
jgi:hypothetical protein